MFGRRLPSWGLWCVLLLFNSCGHRPEQNLKQAGPPKILFLSSLIGYVEPCGCTVDLHLGGLARIAQLIQEERAEGPTAVVVVGPYLFEKQVKPHRVAQEKSKAELIARSLAALKVDAVVSTGTEGLMGKGFFADTMPKSIPDVTANTANGRPRIIQLGTLKLGFIGLVSEGADTPTGIATDPAAAIAQAVPKLRQEGAHVVVALADLDRRKVRRLARKAEGIDLWILGKKPKEEPEAQPVRKGYLLEAGDRGRHLGRIVLHNANGPGLLRDPLGEQERKRKRLERSIRMNDFMLMRTGDASLKARNAKLRSQLEQSTVKPPTGKRFEYTLLPVKQTIGQAAPFAGWVRQYNASLKAINLVHAGSIQKAAEGQSSYSGILECTDCHDEATAFWKKTKHAKAWETLVRNQKTFDAECVGCHVTGWQKPGGTVLGRVDKLTDVQCEVCHGAGSQHVESGGDTKYITRAVPETVCKNCHNSHHSPKFDYAKYVERVTGPGHAK